MLPLERMALAFSRLPELDGGAEIVASMRAISLVRGPSPDTVVMQAA